MPSMSALHPLSDWSTPPVPSLSCVGVPPGSPPAPPHGDSAVHVPTVGATEVVWVVGIILEHKGLLINDQMAPLTDILAQALGLLPVVARPAQVPVGSEAGVRGRLLTPPLPPQTAWATSWEKRPLDSRLKF